MKRDGIEVRAVAAAPAGSGTSPSRSRLRRSAATRADSGGSRAAYSLPPDRAQVNDRQLACAKISSEEGQNYLAGMAAAANYAWVNRSSMTFLARQAFAKLFKTTPEELDMHVIYDVSHNIAKVGQPMAPAERSRGCARVRMWMR